MASVALGPGVGMSRDVLTGACVEAGFAVGLSRVIGLGKAGVSSQPVPVNKKATARRTERNIGACRPMVCTDSMDRRQGGDAPGLVAE